MFAAHTPRLCNQRECLYTSTYIRVRRCAGIKACPTPQAVMVVVTSAWL